jgi:AcrR family transcriptional regulator
MAATATKQRPRLSRERARARIVDAAIELVRERSFAELTVAEIMDRAGLERTIFYRHFENFGELLLGAGREAIEQLYAAQVALAETRIDHGEDALREALEVPVWIYRRHGPLLRAVSEAVAGNQLVAVDKDEIRRRFDDLVAEALRIAAADSGREIADPHETAHALNILNETYLLDAFGREPRVSVEAATRTLTEIWAPLLGSPKAAG